MFRFAYLAGRCYDTNAPGASFKAASGTVLQAAGAAFQTSWATAFAADATGGTGLTETAAWTNGQLQVSVAALIFGDDSDPDPDPPAPDASFSAIKRPVTMAELRPRRCALVYGSAPCTAALGVTGTRKCFNARATCQALAAFEATTHTLRFSPPVENLPLAWGAIPSLRGVSTKSTKLNVAGLSATSGALGLRSAVTLTFQDHCDGDLQTDPYLESRDYDPQARGTFWPKWLARNQDWQGIEIDVLTGDADGLLETFTSRGYFLESVSGPDTSGMVSLVARDILSRVDGKKAQAPRRTDGALAFALVAAATECWITSTAFDDYLQQGGLGSIMRIGREVIRFTTITAGTDDGNRRFTSLERGLYGTTAADHSAGSTVQACLEFVDQPPVEIVQTLLEDFGDVPSSWITIEDWQEEAGRWLLPYVELSALITEPTGVDELLGELCQSVMAYLWTDDKARQIRLRAVRPPEEDVSPLTDGGHILAGARGRSIKMEEQISRAEVFFGVLDPTEKLDEERNYRAARVRVGVQLGEPRVRRIFSRWLKTDAQATQAARTLMGAASVLPVYVTCSVGFKDMAGLGVGSVVELTTRTVQDDTGAELPSLFQVVEATERGAESMALTLRTFGAFPPVSIYLPSDAPDFAEADDDELRRGGFYSDDDGNLGGAPSEYVWS